MNQYLVGDGTEMNVLEKYKEMELKLQHFISKYLDVAKKAIEEGDFQKYDFWINEVRKARNELEQTHLKIDKRQKLEALVSDLQKKGYAIDFIRRVG
jgi:hypothetical protein